MLQTIILRMLTLDIHSVSNGKNCKLVYWVIHNFIHIIFIFTLIVIFCLEDVLLQWFDYRWLCPEMIFLKLIFITNLSNKCHLIKWLEMKQHVTFRKRGLPKMYEIRKGIASFVWIILILRLVPLRHLTQNIIWR